MHLTTLRVMPVDITVLAGRFGRFPAAQPLVFAHLWDIAPTLDLGGVEVIPLEGGTARIGAYFDVGAAARLISEARDADTIVLILPEAYDTLDPPAIASDKLRPLGSWRGEVRRQVGSAP